MIFEGKDYDVPCVWMEFEKRVELREKQRNYYQRRLTDCCVGYVTKK